MSSNYSKDNDKEVDESESFFFKYFDHINPFCGVTDTPVSDFCRCLLWISKRECTALLAFAKAYVIYVP